MITNVYVDGFNLYYGCLKNSSYKWLNIRRLAELSLPNDTIQAIKYFTAPIKGDREKRIRQQFFLRALKTIPPIEIREGHYLYHPVTMKLVTPMADGTEWVQVMKIEEKGSDVNLATHLIHDAHLKKFELAVVISNDSDLVEPIRLIREELGLEVGVLNPHIHTDRPSKQLQENALFFKPIKKEHLRNSLFPNVLTDQKGTFHKPSSW